MRARTLPGRLPARLPRALVATAAGLVLAGTLGPVDLAAAGPVEAAAEGPDGVQVVEVAVHETARGGHSDEYVVAAADGSVEPVTAAEAEALGGPAEPEVAAASTSTHRVYVARVTNAGYYADQSTHAPRIDAVLARWDSETDNEVDFTRPGPIVDFAPPVACTDYSGLWSRARTLFPGVSFDTTKDGNHLVVLVPGRDATNTQSSGCTFGIGTVGTGLAAGGMIVIQDVSQLSEGLAHEIGHNLSLRHANGEVCRTACATAEYDNAYDVMGVSRWLSPPSLSTLERQRLGLLDPGELVGVALSPGQASATGSYTLTGRGTATGTRGLRVTDPVTGRLYYVEWRNGAGRDAGSWYSTAGTSQGSRWTRGVLVERLQVSGNATDLQSSMRSDAVALRSLLPGETLTRGGLSVRVESASTSTDPSASATVTLTLSTAALPADVPSSAPPPTTPSSTTAATTATPPTATPPTPTPVTSAPVIRVDRPRIVGTARPGARLRASVTSTPRAVDAHWTWYVDGRRVKGVDARILRVRSTWRAAKIVVEVEVSSGGASDRARSRAVRVARR